MLDGFNPYDADAHNRSAVSATCGVIDEAFPATTPSPEPATSVPHR